MISYNKLWVILPMHKDSRLIASSALLGSQEFEFHQQGFLIGSDGSVSAVCSDTLVTKGGSTSRNNSNVISNMENFLHWTNPLDLFPSTATVVTPNFANVVGVIVSESMNKGGSINGIIAGKLVEFKDLYSMLWPTALMTSQTRDVLGLGEIASAMGAPGGATIKIDDVINLIPEFYKTWKNLPPLK